MGFVVGFVVALLLFCCCVVVNAPPTVCEDLVVFLCTNLSKSNTSATTFPQRCEMFCCCRCCCVVVAAREASPNGVRWFRVTFVVVGNAILSNVSGFGVVVGQQPWLRGHDFTRARATKWAKVSILPRRHAHAATPSSNNNIIHRIYYLFNNNSSTKW